MSRKFLSSAELARFIGVSRGTITEWIKNGKLPQPLKIGREARWRVEVLEPIFGKIDLPPA